MIWCRAIIGHYQMTKTRNLQEMSWFGRSKHDRRRETPNACGLGALQAAMHARSSKDRKNLWKIGHLSCHLSNLNWNHIKIISKTNQSVHCVSFYVWSFLCISWLSLWFHVFRIPQMTLKADRLVTCPGWGSMFDHDFSWDGTYMNLLIWYAIISNGTFFHSKANG